VINEGACLIAEVVVERGYSLADVLMAAQGPERNYALERPEKRREDHERCHTKKCEVSVCPAEK
jgi:hypothetical protein